MKILLNILLLIAIIVVTYNNNKAHAEESNMNEPKVTENTQGNIDENSQYFVDSDVFDTWTTKNTTESISDENTSLYWVSRYSIEDEFDKKPQILIPRLYGAISGTGNNNEYNLERLEISAEYQKILTTRSKVLASEQEARKLGDIEALDREDMRLQREQKILERNFSFVKTIVVPPDGGEYDIRDLMKPLLGDIFYELDNDGIFSTIEGLWQQLQSWEIHDRDSLISTFLVWKIYQERMEWAQRFICEVPSCEDE